MDAVLEPLLKITSLNEWTTFIISDYIRNLSIPSDNMSANNISAGTPLAVTEDEKKLLTSFCEKHNELILASIYVFAENNKDNTDVKNAIEIIQITNATRDRDNSSYSYNNSTYTIKTRLVQQVIQDYVNSYPIQTIDDLKKELKIKEDMDNIFMSYDEYTRKLQEREGKWVGFFGYKETPSIIITLSNNEKVVVTTNWPLRVKRVPDNFYYFLEKMKELNINIEKVEK